MIKSKAAKPTTIRNHNRGLVLETLKKQERISRADLAKITRMSEPTVSQIVDELLRKGMIREIGPGESAGGRKPVILEFVPSCGYVIGMDVGGTNIKMGISDLGGDLLLKKTFPSKNIGIGEAAVLALADLVNQTIAESCLEKNKIVGVGLAVPGIVEQETGIVSFAPAFQWQDFPVAELLGPKLGIPLSIENDVNAAALAEKDWGVARDIDDFIFISIGTGIGAGLILDGEIHRGYRCAAGEVGYSIVAPNWLRREIKSDKLSFGCLESLAAAPGIVKRGHELRFTKKGDNGEIGTQFYAEDIFRAAGEADPLALQIVDEITDYLAIAIINMTLLVSPRAIVLGGGVSCAGSVLLMPLQRKVNAISPTQPEIFLSAMQAEAGLRGAAALAIRRANQDMITGS